ncbi:MAG TPA: hypothetical protein VN922_01985 [Bacteroidia bacterium]|nr:hypothetical protein [Bacteroidia bacterium]
MLKTFVIICIPHFESSGSTAQIILPILSTLFSAGAIYFSYHAANKNTYVNTITSSRKEWMDRVKGYVSEFSALLYHLQRNEDSINDSMPILEKVNILKERIILELNPSEPIFDKQIIQIVKTLPGLYASDEKKKDFTEKIDELTFLTQHLLKFEWNGIKKEAEQGSLLKEQKDKLLSEYILELERNKYSQLLRLKTLLGIN